MSNIDACSSPIAQHDWPASKNGARCTPQLRLLVVLAIALFTGCSGKSPTESVGRGTQQLRLAPERAFAWANRDEVSLGPPYTPDRNYSFNPSSTLPPAIQNTAPGTYVVQFPGLNAQAGNYQVVAYGGPPGHRCQLKSWSSDTANVMCVDHSGALVNSKFVISYTNDFKNQVDSQGHLTPAGFLFADEPDTGDTASYNPNPAFSYNSSGQLNTIMPDELTRVGIGRYIAVLSGLNTDQGNAQVTAVGDQPAYCKLNGWAVFPGTADLWVGVLCFDAATGAPKNNKFSLQFVSQPGAMSDLYDRAYVWADQLQARIGTVYSPNLFYNYDRLDQSSGNAAEHLATGQYLVGYPHIPGSQQSTAMVSALGDDPNYCNPVRWDNTPDNTVLEVDCFDPLGNAVDESFSAMYLRQESSCGLPDPSVNEGVPAIVCDVSDHLVHPGELQKRDNPILRGYADPSGLSSWQVGYPASGDESYGGSSAPMIVTNPPSIIDEFAKSSFAPNIVPINVGGKLFGATAVLYTPTQATRAGPWMSFDANNDGTHPYVYPPSGSMFPYWAPGVVLPMDHSSVNVQMFYAHGSSSTNVLVNEFSLALDSNVPVVPVYIHILRDNNNNTPTGNGNGSPAAYDALFTAQTLPPSALAPSKDAQIAWNIRQLFDLAAVRHPYGTIAYSNNTVSMSATKTLTDPAADRTVDSGGGDDIFGQCDVQLRLAGVSFIRQGMGLEQTLFDTMTERPIPETGCSNSTFCDSSRAGQLANQLRAVFDAQPGLPIGIHIVVGGQIWPNAVTCGGAVAGVTCDPNRRRISFVDATGLANADRVFHAHTLLHEIGHILTGNANEDDAQTNLMFGYATGGGLLRPSQCQAIHQRAGAPSRL